MSKNKFQSWNGRSKKWCLFIDGKIKEMASEKYSGVPVKKDKPEPAEDLFSEKKSPEKKKEKKPAPAAEKENNAFDILSWND